MKKTIFLLLILLAACQPALKCEQKITCDDGRTFPAEQLVNGKCEQIKYDADPCAAECEKDEDCIPAEPLVGARYLCEEGKCVQKALGNPASEKCIADGGTIEIREGEEGQYGVCILPDGTECEEWAYYRGECAQKEEPLIGSECSKVSPAYRAECCQRQEQCDVAKIAVYHEDTGECTCEETEIKRQCAAEICEPGKFSLYDPNKGRCVCVEAGSVGETLVEFEGEFNEEKARQLVIEAFDKKWRTSGGCGLYRDGLQQPDKIDLTISADGSYIGKVSYYCGEYFRKPAEPDHHKEITVTPEGIVTGLN